MGHLQNKREQSITFRSDNSSSLECANILTCGCLWLSSILNMCKSFLSQKPTAHVLLTEKIIEEFGLKVLKSVIPVVCNILVQITQTEIDLNTTSDACFRSCLALIRSVILFRKECSKQKSMTKKIVSQDRMNLCTVE